MTPIWGKKQTRETDSQVGPYVGLSGQGHQSCFYKYGQRKYVPSIKEKYVLINGQIGVINEILFLKKKKKNSRKSIYTSTISKLDGINTLHPVSLTESSSKLQAIFEDSEKVIGRMWKTIRIQNTTELAVGLPLFSLLVSLVWTQYSLQHRRRYLHEQ